MSGEIRFGEKPFLTNATWERFLFQMSVTVSFMMISVHETFPTYLAYKRKLFQVALHMQLIIISWGELFPALFLCASDVHLLL